MNFEPYNQPYGVEFHAEGVGGGNLFVRGVLEVDDFLASRLPVSNSNNIGWWEEDEVDNFFENRRDEVLMAIQRAVSGALYEDYHFEVEPEWDWHYITRGGELGVQRVEEGGKVHIIGVISLRG